MISILYNDGQNWESESNLFVNWDYLHELYKNQRVQPNYLAPEIITDIWDGKTTDIQHIVWDAWYVEFWIKESEVQEINKLQSCSTIIINDLTNNLKHIVDMQTSEFLQFNEPERMADTSNWKVSFIYRTNKTIINKYVALSNQVTLIGGSTYYSKYQKLNLPTISEQINTEWSDGSQRLLRETNKDGFKVLLYMSDANMQLFKADYNQNGFTIDGTTVIEKLPLEINSLGENNYQIIVSVITNVDQDTKDLSPLNTHDLDIDSGTHFYTDYPTIVSYEEPADSYTNEDGVNPRSKVISKKIINVRLWMNETDMNSVVQLFNVSTDIEIDSVAVLENRDVKVEFLGYDLYQCDIECLTVATPAYPQD